jgi:predicted ATPase
MELAYAGLRQLCAPLLDRLGRLPRPQQQALEIVFGLSTGAAPDRFLVGLALLSLLSAVADEGPVLCVVDDAQWLDQASALTLAFVARRLLAQPVGILFAAREPGEDLQHFSVLEVLGLHNGDARALLGSAVRFTLDARVRDRMIAEVRGNPLALVELS